MLMDKKYICYTDFCQLNYMLKIVMGIVLSYSLILYLIYKLLCLDGSNYDHPFITDILKLGGWLGNYMKNRHK